MRRPDDTQVPAPRDPVLDLIVVPSSTRPGELSLRCPDDLNDGREVMDRLARVGFVVGDRVQLRRAALDVLGEAAAGRARGKR